jgi:hypothetical protein
MSGNLNGMCYVVYDTNQRCRTYYMDYIIGNYGRNVRYSNMIWLPCETCYDIVGQHMMFLKLEISILYVYYPNITIYHIAGAI